MPLVTSLLMTNGNIPRHKTLFVCCVCPPMRTLLTITYHTMPIQYIKGLSDKLSSARKALAPKQKFAFKARRTTTKAPTPKTANEPPAPAPAPAPAPVPAPAPAALENHHVSIGSLSAKYILPPQSPHPHPSQQSPPILLSSLSACFVNLASMSPPASMLAVKDASDCILFCPHISGPAHLTSINNAVLVLACAQFRMHDTHNTDVYLLCPSRPIIEHCTAIRFAPLPLEWVS